MAGRAGGSRLNPVYLARRHAGTAFMLMAAGLAAGAAWRALAMPTRYSAAASVPATATAPGLDWEEKNAEWQGVMADSGAQAVLTNNLRHALKLSATAGTALDETRLAGELLLLRNGTSFPASLLSGLAARLGPAITVRTADVAENLDAQSLAAIAADLDPPSGGVGGGWDFSFFQPASGGGTVLSRPGPNDYYFRVFYHLHGILSGGTEAGSPEEARRSAVREVAGRLDRETQFAGGGGFGPVARRELMREIQTIPILAAAGLYGGGWGSGDGDSAGEGDEENGDAHVWRGRWAAAAVTLAGSGEAGTAGAQISFDLYPIMSPRDTPATRVQPLAAAVATAYFSAREAAAARRSALAARRAARPAPDPTAQAAATGAAEATAVAIEEIAEIEEIPEIAAIPPRPAEPPPVQTIVREEIDEEAAAALQEKIRSAEESLLSDKAALPALARRFAAAREDVARLSAEARSARARADRFRERYDETARAEAEAPPVLSAETERMLSERDALARRLAALLTYCTEEHPFVVEVRRSMAAIDVLLGSDDPAAANRAAEERSTRIANLYLEWETADAAADAADERLRRQVAAADSAQAELTELEGGVLRGEAGVAALRSAPTPMRRIEVRIPVAAAAPAPEAPEAPKPVPVEEAKPAEAPVLSAAAAAAAAARIQTASQPPPPALWVRLPEAIPLHRTPPGLAAVWAGLAAGLAGAILAAVARELWGKRFHTAAEAERLVGLPLLAALPAYDGKSLRAAAKTVKGEVMSAKGRLTFAPPPVDFSEPPPAAKRGKIRPRRRRPRVAAWIVGVLFVLLAGWFYQRAAGGPGFFSPGLAEPSIPVFVPPAPPEERP